MPGKKIHDDVKVLSLLTPSVPRANKLFMYGIRKHWNALHHIKKEYQTPEMWLSSVQTDGLSLQLIPVDKRTLELCMAAMKQVRTPKQNMVVNALRFVPAEFQEKCKPFARINNTLCYFPDESGKLKLVGGLGFVTEPQKQPADGVFYANNWII